MINNVDTKATLINEITRRELDNRRIARAAAVEGIVLLKNNGVLPIAPGKIALYGAGAEKTIKGGTGSGEVNERYSVNIRQGLEDAGYTVATGSWLKDYIDEFNKAETDYGEMMSQKIKGFNVNQILNILSDPFIYPFGRLITDEDIAKSDTDTCIYVVARQSGEGVDKSLDKHEYTLADSELANIEKVAKSYKKTVVVINSGSSMDTSFLGKIEGIDALVFFCQQGCEGGNALADILSGKVCPSGRLTDTWAKSYDDIPFGKEYSAMGDPLEGYYKEGIFVGYRYFDTFGKEPAFPFGFGLSYSSFDISLQKAKKLGTGVQLTAKVVNKGSVVGKEVVQVYVRPPRGELGREFQMLAAFAKTGDLQPGKQEEVSLDIDLASLGAYDEKTAETVLEAGEYLVLVGKNSRDLEPWVVLKLDKKAVIAKHEHALVPDKPIEELKAGHVESAIPAGLQSFELSASDFPFIQHKYVAPDRSGDERVKQFLGKLSVNDCIEIIVGAGMFPGKKGFKAPGAAGATTAKFMKLGLRNSLLADGPAGLRLQRVSTISKTGSIKMIDAQIALLNYLPKLIKRFMFGNPKKDTLIYQYCTAFPVGTSIAQSWNVPLAYRFGQAVGSEMEEYGVSFWLGPGMNIHRNPLCGRNFEYLSEDPRVSGRIAGAITQGVQSRQGRYATLKHFAANNQEASRNKTSAFVSERALREIYLKGFEVAVKEGEPKAFMTSYNKVNGIYSPNSYDLCTKLLRCEWGFTGLVMTDWFSTAKGLADAGLAVKSGNDLMMPGTGKDKKTIKAALKSGVITEKDIRRATAEILLKVLPY